VRVAVGCGRGCVLLTLLWAVGACRGPAPEPAARASASFDAVSRDFIYGSLALSPVSATGAGYHRHNGAVLDERLDDYSAQGLEKQRRFYSDMLVRTGALEASTLDKEQQADLGIIRSNLSLSLLELDTIQSYTHNPTIYVELIGNGLFSLMVLDYAPKEQRFRAIIKRLEGVPALLEQAKANLVDAPEVWNRVARDENDGNVELVDHTLRDDVPDTLKADFAVAADPALAALRSFNTYLKDTLSHKTSDWRLGREKYALKFQHVLGIGKTPEELLAEAEAGMVAVRSEMDKLAAPKTARQALDEIAKHHATPATYMDAAKKSLAEAISFVREKGLVALPTRGNLQVIETPVFMRGVYGVGGFNPAPPLEPHLGAFYWVTPVPPGWPPDRVESKLREYNDYGLQELTIHEAMPGHYVQLEYANDIQPDTRRLLRNIFGNGPYIEGWGFYAQQLMSDEGYLNNSKELRLSYLKQALRALANTILDVRLQTMGMTDQEALDLMINTGFQEKEEATAKLQRAQLSSCQLPTYFAGWRGWLDVREHDKQKRGPAFSLRDFHDRALKEGAVPMPVLDSLLH